MNTPLQIDYCENVVKGPGQILSISVPRELVFRKVWLFYQTSTFTIGKETSIEFLGGRNPISLPVLRKISATMSFGLGVSDEASLNYMVGNGQGVGFVNGQGGLGYDPERTMGAWKLQYSAGAGIFVRYLIEPFDVAIDCSQIRLVTDNPATPTWAMIAAFCSELKL